MPSRSETTTSDTNATEEIQADDYGQRPTGDLAYAVKYGDHWDIWVYNFDTEQNTQLTSEPNSDQWAPAYSHDGSQIAYLSDQTDGTNQVWLMNPDGSGQHPLSNWSGGESIQYVAWSPDDSMLIITLSSDVDRRLVRMPAGGGEITDFIPVSSAFATTSTDRTLLYVTDNTGSPKLEITDYTDPFGDPFIYAEGDAPNITFDGAYMTFQVGEPGGRHIEILKLGGGSLPNIPRVGDDSNPIWLTQTHTFLAFVSSNVAQESIQINRLHDEFTTSIQIAPNDRIWYLSKRFGGSVTALPTVDSAPTSESASTNSQPSASNLSGKVLFWAVACPGVETELSIMGPGISMEMGNSPCVPMDVPQALMISGPDGYQNEVETATTLELPLGHYVVTHVSSGATLSFDLVPTEDYLSQCGGASECIYQWWVTLETNLNAITLDAGAHTQAVGYGSIEVHVADCAPGYSGPDFYDACHDMGNAEARWNVLITGPGDFREILSTYVESSPGPVVARIDGLPPGTYGVELMTKFVKAPAYVFCSPDQGVTVLADQMLADYHDPVQVPVSGNAVVCDWYHLSLG